MTTKITINPQFEFLREYIESIPFQNEELGDVIYRARNIVYKTTVSASAGKDAQHSVTIIIKSFKIPPLYNRFAYTFLRKGKAIASYLNAATLIEKGFLTPVPIACIQCFKGGLLSRSYYVSTMVEGKEIRFWERIPDNTRILRGIATLMAKLHTAGVYHRDFSPGNILYDDNLNFYLLDINRMRFDVQSHTMLMNNFKSVNDSSEEIAKLAAIYADVCGRDKAATVAEALNAHQRYLAMRRRKRFFKRLRHPFRS